MLNQELNGSIFRETGTKVFIKREDLLFPEIQGNKWRKLKYNLAFAKNNGFQQLLSFGGAYSNHIAALAAACKKFGFNCTGIIRGEAPAKLNPTLIRAQENGMHLEFVNRSLYKSYTQSGDWTAVKKKYSAAYIIPEGGTNTLAIQGCSEILNKEDKEGFDIFACPVGTGGTIAGIIKSLQGQKKVLGFPALKGDFLQKEIEQLLTENDCSYSNFSLIRDYHFGGYAKHNAKLLSFIDRFYEEYQISLDPIYTGKMLFGLIDLIKHGFFEPGTRILIIHTGGLQGIAGFNERHGTTLKEK